MMCREVIARTTDELEGALTGWERFMFHLHAKTCPYCRAHHKQVKATIETLASLPRDPPTSESRDRALESFRKRKSV